jgi:YD repeat-containing protein
MARYDAWGHRTLVSFLDVDGNPATNLGAARWRYGYDLYDRQVEATSLDRRGRPVEVLGVATRRSVYGTGPRLTAMVLFDADGRPAATEGCFTGADCPRQPWHAVRVVRDDRGRVVRNLFFDTSGHRVAELDCGRHRCWE